MRASFMSMDDVKMTFTEHLAELRARVIKSLIAVGVCAAAGFGFNEHIFKLLKRPLGKGVTLQYLSPMELFMTKLSIALYVAVFLALPVILY